jgi:hypothetical protein
MEPPAYPPPDSLYACSQHRWHDRIRIHEHIIFRIRGKFLLRANGPDIMDLVGPGSNHEDLLECCLSAYIFTYLLSTVPQTNANFSQLRLIRQKAPFCNKIPQNLNEDSLRYLVKSCNSPRCQNRCDVEGEGGHPTSSSPTCNPTTAILSPATVPPPGTRGIMGGLMNSLSAVEALIIKWPPCAWWSRGFGPPML